MRSYAKYQLHEVRRGKQPGDSEVVIRHNQEIADQENEIHDRLEAFREIVTGLRHDLPAAAWNVSRFTTAPNPALNSFSIYDTLQWNGDPQILISVFYQLKQLKNASGESLLAATDETLIHFLALHFQCSPAVGADRFWHYLEKMKRERHAEKITVALL